MKLTERLSTVLTWRGRKYHLRLSFDRVLLALDAWDSPTLSDEDKVDLFCGIIVRNAPWGIDTRLELVTEIFNRFILSQRQDIDNGPQAFDFTQDADYIYAAFWQTYRIDLLKQRGRLDWRRFYALFLGLPDNTRLSEIMSIRTRDIPERTEYNQEEIASLLKAKQYYALKIHHKPGEKWDEGIRAQMDDKFAYYRSKAGASNDKN